MRNKCSNKIVVSEIIFGTLFLVFGCAIYLFFRSKTLNIYRWCSLLDISGYVDSVRLQVQHWSIPQMVRFSLPDGLYCAAYILIMDAIWHNDDGVIKGMIISLVPIVTISSEILQYFGLIKGTYDTYDLICYSISVPLKLGRVKY